MDGSFHGKVHAAAVSLWWTLLIAAAFVTLQWLAYLGIMVARPAWVVSLWGPGATWESIRTIWFQALLFLKVTLWPLMLAALWLTIWARQLRKSPRSA